MSFLDDLVGKWKTTMGKYVLLETSVAPTFFFIAYINIYIYGWDEEEKWK